MLNALSRLLYEDSQQSAWGIFQDGRSSARSF